MDASILYIPDLPSTMEDHLVNIEFTTGASSTCQLATCTSVSCSSINRHVMSKKLGHSRELNLHLPFIDPVEDDIHSVTPANRIFHEIHTLCHENSVHFIPLFGIGFERIN